MTATDKPLLLSCVLAYALALLCVLCFGLAVERGGRMLP